MSFKFVNDSKIVVYSVYYIVSSWTRFNKL